MTLSEELKWRGFVNQTTLEDISLLDKEKRTFYWGVDPSAPSMQIGNLAAAMMVKVFIKHGYMPILLVGGATGLIGDPDGKAQERDLKTPAEIEANKKSIVHQYETIFEGNDFKVVDNYDWFKDFGYMQFLREVGKHVPMRQMLAREFVQSRLSEGGAGISYAEFSYSLIQGYDFLHLLEKHGVTLQISGADQWGNCIAGVDLIRRKTGKVVHVWTSPLIMNKSTGKKFGKSEEGAVWLDANMTSPYQFYQFWLNSDDEGVEDYIKIYTELSKEEIEKLMRQMHQSPELRVAQHQLAYEVTKIVHGTERAYRIQAITTAIFGGNFSDVTESQLRELKAEVPVVSGKDLIVLLAESKLASSNTEARRFINDRAVYINGTQIVEGKYKLGDEDFIGEYALMRRGKNKLALVKR